MESIHILVIDDEIQMRRLLRASLSERGYRVTAVGTGAKGLDAAACDAPGVVILDLGLPDRDGLEVCRELRTWTDVPIIVVSARADDREKVRVLDAGADDYLTKPFGLGELLARLRVAQRHADQRHAAGSRPPPVIVSGAVRIDLARRQVTRSGNAVHLTPTEYTLLVFLATHAGRVLTHQWLVEHIWGPSYTGSMQILHVFISQVRRKIEPQPAQPRVILTEPGIGYRFASSESSLDGDHLHSGTPGSVQ